MEKGCIERCSINAGLSTAWHPHPKGGNRGIVPGADFNFNLPWLYPSGCVEKAVVAAGGIKNLKC